MDFTIYFYFSTLDCPKQGEGGPKLRTMSKLSTIFFCLSVLIFQEISLRPEVSSPAPFGIQGGPLSVTNKQRMRNTKIIVSNTVSLMIGGFCKQLLVKHFIKSKTVFCSISLAIFSLFKKVQLFHYCVSLAPELSIFEILMGHSSTMLPIKTTTDLLYSFLASLNLFKVPLKSPGMLVFVPKGQEKEPRPEAEAFCRSQKKDCLSGHTFLY